MKSHPSFRFPGVVCPLHLVTALGLCLASVLAGCGAPGTDDVGDWTQAQAANSPPRIVFLNFSGSSCGYGTLAECKRKLQEILDGWYADFNVVFTHTSPTTPPFYKVDVTFNGSAGSGASQLSCADQFGGSIICRAQVGGARALVSNAGTIAHEHGHSVGLHHSDGPTDIMNQRADNNTAGFDDKENNLLDNKHCGPTQNSYRLMLERLGRWPGGCKTGPFGDYCPDGAGGTPGTGGTPGAGGSVGNTNDSRTGGQRGTGGDGAGGSRGDGGTVGDDAPDRSQPGDDGMPDGDAAPGADGGCSVLPRERQTTGGSFLSAALVAWFLFTRRVRRGASAPHPGNH